jgi:hypothetical protein
VSARLFLNFASRYFCADGLGLIFSILNTQPIPHRHPTNLVSTAPAIQRKNGLFKKAYELGVLCSVDVAVIIFGALSPGRPDPATQPADPYSIFIQFRGTPWP